jgi:hypothetical protein
VGFEVGRFGFQVGRGLARPTPGSRVGLVRPTSARPRCGSRLTHARSGETQAWVSPNPHHGSGETQDGSGSRERFGVFYVGFWLFY